MTRQGFLDNYIGFHFKNIKTFHNYLKTYRNIDTGPLQNVFIVRKEEPPVIVLATERLKYLMHNAQFRSLLAPNLVSSLDMFIFGCCTGLRFSDLTRLRKNNLQFQNNSIYLIVRSKKTQVDTRIKLPNIALNSLKPYQNKQLTLFPKISLSQFNCNLKKLLEIAGWTEECPKLRTRNGHLKAIKTPNGKNYRFCDLASSHLMRKTAITSMLLLGMPEPLVRKISGHAINSKEFYRYVNYSQSFLDVHTDAVFEKFDN
jgi:integrase